MADLKPPFTEATARAKVKMAQDAWNTRDPARCSQAYTADSIWRNRAEFLRGTAAIVDFLGRKWARERGYRLRKELFSFGDDRIAVQFWYEYYTEEEEQGGATTRRWRRAYGLEDWTFDVHGKMRKRQMSANEVDISEEERWFKDGVDVNSVEIGEEHW